MLGILLACFRCLRTKIGPFDRLIVGDEAVHNDLDCLLLMFTHNLNFILPSAIQCPVSVVHACSDSCTFHHSTTFTTIEREAVDTNKIVLKHDWNIFCLYMYCKFFAISLVLSLIILYYRTKCCSTVLSFILVTYLGH